MSKIVVGFPMYAKWFVMDKPCTTIPPIGCQMLSRGYENADGSDNGTSGTYTWNNALNSLTNDSIIASSSLFATSGTDDAAAHASAWYDSANSVFWTWASAADISAACGKYKDQIMGMSVWSLNQDVNGASGGEHISAIASCLA